jgi:hypothetical protein
MSTPAGRSSLWLLVCCLASGGIAAAQSPAPFQGDTRTVPELTMAGTVSQAVAAVGSPGGGDAINLATRLAIATAPFGVSSGGFQIKLDPTTGLQVRTATTFGPAFAERAITSGEGSVNIGVSYMSSKLDRLGSDSFAGLELRTVTAAAPQNARIATSDLTLTANTVVIAARLGVTDKLDVGMALPLTTVKVGGFTSLVDGNGTYLVHAAASGASDGLGDITGLVKYRFYSFGTGQPDPGGLAFMASMRLPTGSEENLRGLGITRTQVTLIASSGTGRFRPHGNVGFEYCSKGVSVPSEAVGTASVTARHQLQYAAGFEFEAAPKATILADLLGGQIYGGGRLGIAAIAGAPNTQGLVALDDGLSRVSFVPGVKVNLKGKMLLSVNAIIALSDSGLHARVTPVAGLDVTF